MSMNKFMHPRNIYKTPPNFKQLAIDYPEFRQFVTQELTGKVTLNFKDTAALRALTCVLLKKDFGLDVNIPLTKLIPTIPLRFNYILWIEDLLEIAGLDTNVKGIDLGTGASCIYPLIAAKKYGWSMLATEINNESIKFATENVTRNQLEHLITVKKVENNKLIKDVIGDNIFDFCMCNPPFFGSQQETLFQFKSRKESRPRPKNAFCAFTDEIIVKGGEVEFISNLIQESKDLQNQIKVYSTMIGQKSSLVHLKKILREVEVVSFKQTEFCQGNTTRWGLAWTYCDIDLRKVPKITLAASRKVKQKNPVHFLMPNIDSETSVDDFGKKIEDIFNKLLIDFKEIKHSKNVIAYNIIAHSDTWSHQRRKRREQIRSITSKNIESPTSETNENNNQVKINSNNSSLSDGQSSSSSIEHTVNLISEMQVKSPGKRGLEDDDEEGYYNNKKFRATDENEPMDVAKAFIESNAIIRKDNEGIHFELLWIDGVSSRDSLHQILQYVKNQF